ncbi:MAG: hypothetical protein ACLU38_08585 [Dysosmobacter sp.]
MTKGISSTIRPGLQGIFPDTGEIGQFSPLCGGLRTEILDENAVHFAKVPRIEDISSFR